jgi:long-chain-fatty-acid--CoA ligase ACSBG
MGVPRVWEKFAEALQDAGKKVAALKGMRAMMPILCCFRKKTVGTWAKRHGLESMRNKNMGGSGKTTGMYGLADALVLSKVRAQLGLDCVKLAVTAAAPIGRDTLEFLGAYGLIVTEAYGMSESCGCASFSTDDKFLWGSCGFPMPGTQVKIFRVDAEDKSKKTECPKAKDVFQPTEEEQGEICYRGRHVMMGYLANPALGDEHVKQAEQQTRDTIDEEGWLHSGDMGVFGENGMIRITGRYKELIITAGGENIAPVPIEENVMKLCPLISFAMMLGDKRKFNTMIVTLKSNGDKLIGEAANFVEGVTTVKQGKEHPEFLKAVEKAILDTNNDSKICPSNASRVQKFRILPLDFTVENDELTPTLKLKRKNVEKRYCRTIEAMYDDGTEKPAVEKAQSNTEPSETTAAISEESVPALPDAV